jgi:hypothetical protein
MFQDTECLKKDSCRFSFGSSSPEQAGQLHTLFRDLGPNMEILLRSENCFLSTTLLSNKNRTIRWRETTGRDAWWSRTMRCTQAVRGLYWELPPAERTDLQRAKHNVTDPMLLLLL